MENLVIYTDNCLEYYEKKLAEQNVLLIKRYSDKDWSVRDAMYFIAAPSTALAVFNRIDSISLMEISLLHFMCKPILITTSAIKEYPVVERTVDYIDTNCDLMEENGSFVTWFKLWRSNQWI